MTATWEGLLKFQAASERLDFPTPSPVLRGLQLRSTAIEEAREPVGALLALDTDTAVRDRITTMSINRHDGNHLHSAKGLDAGLQEFLQQLLGEVREATLPHLEAIVAEAAVLFEEAAAPLVRARQDFGFTGASTETQLIDRVDLEALKAWRATRTALQELTPFLRWRALMSEVFDVAPTAAHVQRIFWTEPTLDLSVAFAAGESWSIDRAYYAGGAQATSLDWLAIAATGLTLNTPSEVEAKYEARANQTMEFHG